MKLSSLSTTDCNDSHGAEKHGAILIIRDSVLNFESHLAKFKPWHINDCKELLERCVSPSSYFLTWYFDPIYTCAHSDRCFEHHNSIMRRFHNQYGKSWFRPINYKSSKFRFGESNITFTRPFNHETKVHLYLTRCCLCHIYRIYLCPTFTEGDMATKGTHPL